MTKTAAQRPNGARLRSAAGKDSDAPRRESPPQPHPDDWPADISEPEFLELTKVYSGDEPRGQEAAAAAKHAEPSPDRPLPGDDMQSYHRADDDAEEAISASDPARKEPAHAPEDFISEPVEAEALDTSQAEPMNERAGRGAAPTPEDFEQAYPAEKARQGRIVLDAPERRALFLGGLVGLAIAVLALVLLETV